MKRLRLGASSITVATLVLSGAVLATARPDPEQDFVAPGAPAIRARVVLGDEIYDLPLDGSVVTTSDGRPLSAVELPTKLASFPGAFSFEYPKEWSFSGAVGSPETLCGWWSVIGDHAMVHLQRHGEDALAIRDSYADNMVKGGGTNRRPCSATLGGRVLEGLAVDGVSFSVGPYPQVRYSQEIYGFRASDGAAWLLVIQTPDLPESAFPAEASDGLVILLDDGRSSRSRPTAAAAREGLATFRATFAWAR
ncbi:MAG: hypothetical protein R3F34_10315 [Planctomycetota bacterium]